MKTCECFVCLGHAPEPSDRINEIPRLVSWRSLLVEAADLLDDFPAAQGPDMAAKIRTFLGVEK